MQIILLLLIQLYWKIIPKSKRRRCIYLHSCSRYVYDETRAFGLIVGLKALAYRVKRCNPNFVFFENPVTGRLEIILSTGEVLGQDEMAERLCALPECCLPPGS